MPYATTKTDIYTNVTNRIIEALESGTRPWLKPWRGGSGTGLPLRHNDERYKGVNVIMLWLEAEIRGYKREAWMTYQQAQELGGQVRKGEKSTQVVFFKPIVKETDDGKKESFPMLRTYNVFNVDQIDGLDDKYPILQVDSDHEPISESERIAHAEAYVKATKAEIRHMGSSAHYSLPSDTITMPPFTDFSSGLEYYGTLLHELVHWTSHEKRLNRKAEGLKPNRKNIDNYGREELIAEIGACFVGASLGIMPVLDNHASYIRGWIHQMKSDNRIIFSVTAAAQKAADYLDSLQGTEAATIDDSKPMD